MATEFLTKKEQEAVVKCIEKAEQNTTGEIRVHIESYCEKDIIERAIDIFNQLKMYETENRNGILILIACNSHKLAIIGDEGVNTKVPEDFWHINTLLLGDGIKSGDIAGAICNTIRIIGEKLKELYPYQGEDNNEQSNEISYGS